MLWRFGNNDPEIVRTRGAVRYYGGLRSLRSSLRSVGNAYDRPRNSPLRSACNRYDRPTSIAPHTPDFDRPPWGRPPDQSGAPPSKGALPFAQGKRPTIDPWSILPGCHSRLPSKSRNAGCASAASSQSQSTPWCSTAQTCRLRPQLQKPKRR